MTGAAGPVPSLPPQLPRLATPRLRLRPFCDADLPGMVDLYASEATARYLGGTCNDEDAWRRMAAFVGHVALRGYGVWAIEEPGSGEFVGYAGPWYPHGWPEPEIAWALRARFHGRGYATEAAGRALEYAYAVLGWTTAVSVIANANRPSIAVALRLGATLERHTVNRGWDVGVYRHRPPERG